MDQTLPTSSVLVVDDDGRIRDLLCELLEGEGYAVTAASDGLQAWEQLTTSEQPLIVVLDEVLPQLRGLDLLARVAAQPQLVRRHAYLLLTATAHHLRTRPLPLPIPILPKPCDFEAFLALVGRMAQQLQQSPGDALSPG
jgi:CheY-like chemotaxis protein